MDLMGLRFPSQVSLFAAFIPADVLQRQYPHLDPDAGNRRSHAGAGGAAGGGERAAGGLQHATDPGEQGQVSGGTAGPVRRALRRPWGERLSLSPEGRARPCPSASRCRLQTPPPEGWESE